MSQLRELYPAIESYNQGYLQVLGGHDIYFGCFFICPAKQTRNSCSALLRTRVAAQNKTDRSENISERLFVF